MLSQTGAALPTPDLTCVDDAAATVTHCAGTRLYEPELTPRPSNSTDAASASATAERQRGDCFGRRAKLVGAIGADRVGSELEHPA
jgi:hypothetical protein